jgi:ketosteroid isomerase-like protein
MAQIYPSKEEVASIFKNVETGNFPEFMKYVSPNVDWTVMGTPPATLTQNLRLTALGTHPCAGRYTSLASFNESTNKRLGAIMKEPGIKLLVRNIIASGEWVVVEMVSKAECKNGLNFDNTYAWVCRFEGGVIVQVRAYLDSAIVKQAIEENECPSHRADTRI